MKTTILALGVALVLGPATTAPAAPEIARKLIEFGWDEPDTAFLQAHLGEMQQTPFDGCVFHAECRLANGSIGNFSWLGWGTNRFREPDVRMAMDNLRGTRFGRFKHNFLRFNTTPAKMDWFDDYSAVFANATLAAQLARAGKCPGILFDIEQYEGELFDYRKQRDRDTKSWESYAAQVRVRGAQVMRAFQAGYTNLVVFLTFGYSLPWAESGQGKKPLSECHYGLLAPFLDGMVAAAQGRARLVDGHELSYAYRTAERYAKARQAVKHDLLPIVDSPEQYERFFSLGFGVWMDQDWRKKGWNTEDVEKNYFSPAAFEASVRAALQASDEYVWIYTETPRWWSAEGRPVKLPAVYLEALKRAQKSDRQAP